jgi:hypothetical protein
VTDAFAGLGREVAGALGAPGLHMSVVPHPIGELQRTQVTERSRRAFEDIMAQLAAERASQDSAASPAQERFIDAGATPEEVDDAFYRRGWSDGLPIVPPTPGRVEAMLRRAAASPDTVLGVIAPRQGVATLEKIAINAVMAGCRPEHFPVVVAAVTAVCRPEFNLLPMQATTNPVTPLIVVNGPAARALQVNSRDNVLGQGARANATIGRALRLALTNIGGGVPGRTDKACHGQPGKYSMCVAEAEDASPWEPLHVERGFARGDSTVTVIGVTGTQDIIHYARTSAGKVLDAIVRALPREGFKNLYSGGEPLFMLGPEQAAILGAAGLSKMDVKEAIYEGTRVAAASFAPETLELIRTRRPSLFGEGTDAGAIPIADAAGDIQVIVAGGAGNHTVFLPTWGDTRCVTVPIAWSPEPPAGSPGR